jgi:hypothetical protein
MISDERLMQICEDDHVCCGDAAAMAKELLALRNQPVSQHYKLPDGWKLVPVEPTGEMLEEIWLDERFKELAMRRRYEAMLRAAPIPPQ